VQVLCDSVCGDVLSVLCVCLCHLGVRCRLFLGGGLVWDVVGGVGVGEFVDCFVGCVV